MNGHDLVKAVENFNLDAETNAVGVALVNDVIVVEVAGVVTVAGEDINFSPEPGSITEVDGVTSKPIVHRKKR